MKASIVAITIVIALGCMPQRSVIGRWATSFRDIKVQLDLHKDGTLTGSGGLEGMKATVNGHYSIQNQDVSITIDGASIDSDSPNPVLFVLGEKIKGQKESGHIEWKNEDQFVLTNSQGIPIVFDRVKE